jgi:hypothetical protein
MISNLAFSIRDFYFYFSKGVTQINRKVFPQKVYLWGFTAFAFFSRVV